jgi:hypothetical protein
MADHHYDAALQVLSAWSGKMYHKMQQERHANCRRYQSQADGPVPP